MLKNIVSTYIPEINPELPLEDYKPVIEYYEPKYSLLIRAHVINFYAVNSEVYLVVQPLATSFCGAWVVQPKDGTTLSISAALIVGQVG